MRSLKGLLFATVMLLCLSMSANVDKEVPVNDDVKIEVITELEKVETIQFSIADVGDNYMFINSICPDDMDCPDEPEDRPEPVDIEKDNCVWIVIFYVPVEFCFY